MTVIPSPHNASSSLFTPSTRSTSAASAAFCASALRAANSLTIPANASFGTPSSHALRPSTSTASASHTLRQPFRSRRKKLFSGKLLIHAKGLPPCRHRRLIPQIIPHPGTRSRRTASAISTTAAAVSFSSIPVTVSGTISTSIISGTSHQAYRATAAICAPVTSLLAQKSIRNQFTNKHNI